jgi:hypothetical protein
MPAEPRAQIKDLEESASLPAGVQERFNGYGVMGLPLTSGHILALRPFPASSVGPAYTSLWHRAPQGTWTFYADVSPVQARLSDYWIPPREIQAIGRAYFDPPDLARHASRECGARTGDDG